MRFKTLFAVCALFGSLFQSSPSLSETLRTAWLGEHEAFLTWYAKEKGWDKEAGLDIIMLRFDSGKSLIENVRAYDWAIAGCGAVPAMQATMSDQVEVIAIANDESSANMILTRPDSPILAEKGFNPDFPNVFGTPESVKGKLILCPKKTSDKWLAALGLEEKDVKIEELEPTPALGAFKNGYGDILAVWSPFTREAETLGFKVAAHSQDCGATQPVLLVADRAFTEKNPDAVRAFLKVYLRVVDEIKAQGPEILAPAYVRFAEAWMGKKFSEADAIAELREHPVFSLEEQLALFGEDGESPLKAWLAEIAAFSEKMNPDTAHRHATPEAVSDRFLKALIPFHPAFRRFYPEPGETATETQWGLPLSRYTSVKTPPTLVQGREAFSCVWLNGKTFPV